VYLIYGIHQMMNCVCGPGAAANAVLLRAAEPLPASAPWLHKSAVGPGNLCKAFGIGREHNRADLCSAESDLFIAPRVGPQRPRLLRGPRIGVDYAGIWAAEPLRFCDAASAFVSKPRPKG
jgi:DNA-3-methyladenine glycosylase